MSEQRYGYDSYFNPKGTPENIENCIVKMFSEIRSCGTTYQCTRKRGFGPDKLYCKQHANSLQKRKEKDELYQKHLDDIVKKEEQMNKQSSIIINYPCTIFYTNRNTKEIEWYCILSQKPLEEIKKEFEEASFKDAAIDYTQPISIISGWLTEQQIEALFEGPKQRLEIKK